MLIIITGPYGLLTPEHAAAARFCVLPGKPECGELHGNYSNLATRGLQATDHNGDASIETLLGFYQEGRNEVASKWGSSGAGTPLAIPLHFSNGTRSGELRQARLSLDRFGTGVDCRSSRGAVS
jgi:hypothetical protein